MQKSIIYTSPLVERAVSDAEKFQEILDKVYQLDATSKRRKKALSHLNKAIGESRKVRSDYPLVTAYQLISDLVGVGVSWWPFNNDQCTPLLRATHTAIEQGAIEIKGLKSSELHSNNQVLYKQLAVMKKQCDSLSSIASSLKKMALHFSESSTEVAVKQEREELKKLQIPTLETIEKMLPSLPCDAKVDDAVFTQTPPQKMQAPFQISSPPNANYKSSQAFKTKSPLPVNSLANSLPRQKAPHKGPLSTR